MVSSLIWDYWESIQVLNKIKADVLIPSFLEANGSVECMGCAG